VKRAVLVGVLLLVGLASPSNAADRDVVIPGKLFEPERLELLVGDTVTWANNDAVTHTITADDSSFDSGDLEPGASFSATFAKPGRTTYHCAIHHFMTGEIDAFALALSGPPDPVPIDTWFELSGLAPPDTGVLTVERRGDDGAFAPAAEATVAGDGHFRVSVPALASADYRAVADALASSVVHVSVSPRVTLRAQRSGSVVQLEGSAAPAQPGMPVALQVYSRERFAWLRVARAHFDARSRARFRLHPRRTLRLRLALLRASQGLVGGTSNVLVVAPR